MGQTLSEELPHGKSREQLMMDLVREAPPTQEIILLAMSNSLDNKTDM